jgi:hypothetical protein
MRRLREEPGFFVLLEISEFHDAVFSGVSKSDFQDHYAIAAECTERNRKEK